MTNFHLENKDLFKKDKVHSKTHFVVSDDSCIIEVPAEKYELYQEMLLNSGLDPNIKITRIKL